MNNDSQNTTKRRRIKLYHILILLILIGAGAFIRYKLNLKKELQKRKDAIRAAGYPITYEELNDYYSIPGDAENAAYFVLDASVYYQKPKNDKLLPVVGQAELPACTEPLTIKMLADISAYLKENQQSLELLHETAALEYGRYSIDFTFGEATRLDHLSNIRQSVRMLHLAAIYYGEYQKADEAIQSIETIFGVSRSLSNEPVIISQLVRIALQNIAVSAIVRIINRNDFNEAQLILLQELFTENIDLSGMTRAFVGERCQILFLLENPTILNSDIIGDGVPPVPILEAYKALGFSDRDAITYLDIMDEYIQVSKLPFHERIKAADIIEAKANKILKTHYTHYLLNTFMPAFSRYVDIDLRSIAQLLTAQVALAVQHYRLNNGNLPNYLNNLVPEYLTSIPLDPFDGQELRYKKLDPGFVIYSVGEDLSDDNGTEMPENSIERNNSRWDITFFIKR